jgi:hypothetical protein
MVKSGAQKLSTRTNTAMQEKKHHPRKNYGGYSGYLGKHQIHSRAALLPLNTDTNIGQDFPDYSMPRIVPTHGIKDET